MNHTKEIEQIMQYELDAEIEYEEEGILAYVELSTIETAAARINELVQPKWWYPEKGELPTDEQEVFVCLPHAKEAFRCQYFYDDTDPRYPLHVFTSERGHDYYAHNIVAWTPYIVPTPPVEKEVSSE